MRILYNRCQWIYIGQKLKSSLIEIYLNQRYTNEFLNNKIIIFSNNLSHNIYSFTINSNSHLRINIWRLFQSRRRMQNKIRIRNEWKMKKKKEKKQTEKIKFKGETGRGILIPPVEIRTCDPRIIAPSL